MILPLWLVSGGMELCYQSVGHCNSIENLISVVVFNMLKNNTSDYKLNKGNRLKHFENIIMIA